ncbi:MAG: thioredoxin domain-containing protein [Desulfobacteraceae bacterium]|jgi:protein-disulfide isomerase
MCRKIILIALFFLSSLSYAVFGEENISDLENELEELRQDQKSLHEEIKMIKNLLLQGQKPALPGVNVKDVEIELNDNPAQGSEAAPLVIVEFSDYQCSFCARHTKQTYPEIYEKYIKTGKLRYVFMDKPLPSHDMSAQVAEAAHCAAEQGKFWEMHEELLYEPESQKDFTSLASELDLDIKKFESCMKSEKYADKVASNLSLANKLEVPSVPGFVIASRDPTNPQKVRGISFIRGAKPFDRFQKEIEQALADLKR